jgi:ATP-binding cassette subfamily C protein CydC/ATP-binding cassette subfamily C protein CydCD
MSALRRVATLAPPRRGRLALGVALAALTLLAGAALLMVSGVLISKAALRPPVLALGVLIAAVRGLALGRATLRYLERLVSHDVALRQLARLREVLFARLVGLGGDGLRVGRGDLLARFVQDVDRLQNVWLRALGPVLAAALAVAVVTAAAWVVLPAAGLVLGAGLLLAATVVPAVALATGRHAARGQAPARATLTRELLEVLDAGPELVVAGRGAERRRRLADADGRLAVLGRRDAAAGATALGLGTALQGLTVVAVAVVTIPAVDAGRVDGILLAGVVLLALAAFEAVAPLGAAAHEAVACAAAARRVVEVADAEPAVRPPAEARPLSPGGALEVDGVHVALGGRAVLRGASLRVEPGRCVALVGPSGGGKTTLAELLVRFRDADRGHVRLGGADVRELAPDDLRRAVCLVAQDAALFTTTIAENVRLARPQATDAEVRSAVHAAGLGRWLAALPDGMDTQVGEDGAQVSGGQRRRIAVARALLADARFLVLDEPTAHLDPDGARALLAVLLAHARARGQGLLCVLHGGAGLDGFDDVCELAHGTIGPAAARL